MFCVSDRRSFLSRGLSEKGNNNMRSGGVGLGSRAVECLGESEWTGYLWVLLFFVKVWGFISDAGVMLSASLVAGYKGYVFGPSQGAGSAQSFWRMYR